MQEDEIDRTRARALKGTEVFESPDSGLLRLL